MKKLGIDQLIILIGSIGMASLLLTITVALVLTPSPGAAANILDNEIVAPAHSIVRPADSQAGLQMDISVAVTGTLADAVHAVLQLDGSQGPSRAQLNSPLMCHAPTVLPGSITLRTSFLTIVSGK